MTYPLANFQRHRPTKLCGGVNGRYESPTKTSLVDYAACIAEDKAEREEREGEGRLGGEVEVS